MGSFTYLKNGIYWGEITHLLQQPFINFLGQDIQVNPSILKRYPFFLDGENFATNRQLILQEHLHTTALGSLLTVETYVGSERRRKCKCKKDILYIG